MGNSIKQRYRSLNVCRECGEEEVISRGQRVRSVREWLEMHWNIRLDQEVKGSNVEGFDSKI